MYRFAPLWGRFWGDLYRYEHAFFTRTSLFLLFLEKNTLGKTIAFFAFSVIVCRVFLRLRVDDLHQVIQFVALSRT